MVAVLICLILAINLTLHFVLHSVVLKSIKQRVTHPIWHSALVEFHLFNRLALILQGAVALALAQRWLPANVWITGVIEFIAQLWILFFSLEALFSLLDTLLCIARHRKIADKLPLRGIFQGIKLVISAIFVVISLSLMIGKSPLLLFSGLGAMSAVLMLVFKDPILGLVAGIQLSTNNMLHVGDWLEMPKYGADGDVIDIGLTTVKVRNWDKTITTIPTYALISDSFKNWRGMSESGGRRIKRSFNIDVNSIRFLTPERIEYLRHNPVLVPYLDEKLDELCQYNETHKLDMSMPLNGRRLTNIGTFRAYLLAYLRVHPFIHQEMTLLVRQLAPTTQGLPIEIYAFTNTTAWAAYEDIQSDIFDHIFAVTGEFELEVHQTPGGRDVTQLAQCLQTART